MVAIRPDYVGCHRRSSSDVLFTAPDGWFSDLFVPTAARFVVLPPAACVAPRPQAAKPAHQRAWGAEAG